jgi:hypothetical protein
MSSECSAASAESAALAASAATRVSSLQCHTVYMFVPSVRHCKKLDLIECKDSPSQ